MLSIWSHPNFFRLVMSLTPPVVPLCEHLYSYDKIDIAKGRIVAN